MTLSVQLAATGSHYASGTANERLYQRDAGVNRSGGYGAVTLCLPQDVQVKQDYPDYFSLAGSIVLSVTRRRSRC